MLSHASHRHHDVIFLYSKTEEPTWHTLYLSHRDEYLESHYSNVEPETGRRYTLGDLLNPNKNRPHLTYEFPPGSGSVRVWRWTKQRMMEAWDEGRIVIPHEGGVPRFKRYLDEMKGTPVTTVWTDIPPINSQAQERLGYPTQKPLPLLERIIAASSNEGEILLDPFCGCGTAIHAAQKLKRNWIGIDITHLAISLVEKRLRDAFPGIKFEIHGTPKDFDSAADLAKRDKYQFQWWACSLVNAQPYQGKKKGADTGIDGLIYFQDDKGLPKKIVVSVKAGENIGVAMIRDFAHVIDREKAALGLFITLAEPTRAMKEEAASFGFYESLGTTIFPKLQILTIKGFLDGTKTARYPDLTRGGLTFKKAKKEKTEEQLSLGSDEPVF